MIKVTTRILFASLFVASIAAWNDNIGPISSGYFSFEAIAKNNKGTITVYGEGKPPVKGKTDLYCPSTEISQCIYAPGILPNSSDSIWFQFDETFCKGTSNRQVFFACLYNIYWAATDSKCHTTPDTFMTRCILPLENADGSSGNKRSLGLDRRQSGGPSYCYSQD